MADETAKKNVKSLACGLDIGTMNLVFGRADKPGEFNITRNMFLKLDVDEVPMQDLKDISHLEVADSIYIIGEDSFRMANLFNKKVSRPMERGMISPSEIDAIDVLTAIVKNMFGDTKDKEVYVSYSVPAEAIDLDRSVTYHEKVFSRILNSLGINHKSVNESMSIIYSECAKENYTGIGISFGAGMCNVACSYKGVEVFKFSTTRSGDWIDTNVANSLDIMPNRVTNIKEKYLNLIEDFSTNPNKKIRRVLEALNYYYNTMIDYTVKNIIKQFDKKFDLEIDEPLPIIVSGGTSLAGGFLKIFSENINKKELPFIPSEIRQPANPLTAVCNGLLVKTMADLTM
jgi:hypothetical protein